MLRRIARGALFGALLAVAALAGPAAFRTPAHAAEAPIPPMPAQWVTDTAGALSSTTVDSLNAQLADYAKKTGHQIIVWVGQTTGDAPLEDWTIRAFTKWKVGRKGLDDGLALFVLMADHKIRIEVGYGLEGQVTDARASQIARNVIAPRLKAGEVDGAVTDGVNALISVIGGASPGQTGENGQASTVSRWDTVIPIAFMLIFLIVSFAARSSRYAAGRGYTIGSAGYGPAWWGGFGGGNFGGSSGGGGFGGFSGGGGMGGGGGASASW